MTDLDLYDANRVLHRTYTLDGDNEARLIGEDENVLSAFLAYVFAGQHTMIRGFSGSGKSIMANSIWGLMPESSKKEMQSSTGAAIFNQQESLMDCDAVYISEMQKFAQSIEAVELLKSWGEGKSYTREKSVQNDEGEWETVDVELPPRPVLTTIAEENEDADVGDETMRRNVVLYADPSRDQTEQIVQSKAERYSNPWADHEVNDALVNRVRQRVSDIVTGERVPVALPGFDEAFADKLPTEFHDTRSVMDHFLNVIDGAARFYAEDRIMHEDYLVATPRDLYEAFEVYNTILLNNCLRLENLGEEVLKVFPKYEGFADQQLSVSDVQQELKHNGVMVPRNKVKTIISNLLMSGYLAEDAEGHPTEYHRSGIAANEDHLVTSWGEVVDTVLSEASDIFNVGVYDDYRRVVEDNLVFPHPVSGDSVDLREEESSTDPTAGSEREVEPAAREENETLVPADDDDEDDDGGAQEELGVEW